MNKITIGILLIFLAFPSKAQEEFVVRGFLEELNFHFFRPSPNFQRNMFCYFQGEYVVLGGPTFFTFRVDSVLSGSFYIFDNEIKKPPFSIVVGLINEASALDARQYYTLQIRRFPHTNFFYVDNLNQVYPNERFLDEVAERNERHRQNIDILTNGTLRERQEVLNSLIHSGYNDVRYIPYVLPYITSSDSVTFYQFLAWNGHLETTEETRLYSDFVYRYLRRVSPFPLPDRATTDSIGWHKWYKSLFSENCFAVVKYAASQSKLIANATRDFWIDASNRTIHFREDRIGSDIFTLNMDTNGLIVKSMPHCIYARVGHTNYSIQNNEMARFAGILSERSRGLGLWYLNNGIFCQSDRLIPLDLRCFNRGPVGTLPHLIIHSGDNFFVFSSQNPDGYNRLKAGKINRNGEWVIEPKILYKKDFEIFTVNPPDIDAFSFYQSDKNATTLVFSDRTHGRSSQGANESSGAVFVYRVNANLEITDSVVLTIDFPHRSYRFFRTQLLKNNNTYLLLAQTYGRDANRRLFYRLLDSNLMPKTDFISLSSSINQNWHADPITSNLEVRATATSEGFLISWNDNDLSEHVTRSVLIDTSGRQSDIVNIANQRIRQIFNVEFDENNVDIFIRDTDGNLIRKRINKSEFGL